MQNRETIGFGLGMLAALASSEPSAASLSSPRSRTSAESVAFVGSLRLGFAAISQGAS